MQPLEHYAAQARAAGVPRDQFEHFVKAGIVLQPRQLQASAAARECDRPGGPTEILFGGARGGGKSHWFISQIGADDCQRVPELKVLLLRKVGKANKENFEDTRRRTLMGLPHKYDRMHGILTFANGSRIIAGHFQHEKDIDAYLGLEYDIIAIEEAGTLSARKISDIRTCNRTSKANFRPRMYLNTNPGGIGHAQIKARFIEPYRRGRETDTRFIASTVDDNKFVNSEYKRTLEKLTGWQLKAWRFGDWDIAAGQFFTNFRRDAHVRTNIEHQPGWRVWCALDYGFTHYTVVTLLCQDGDGNIYILDEHAERGWLPARHAAAVAAMLGRHKLEMHQLSDFVAGADVWSKNEDGRTTADTYEALGILLAPANTDRINGASEILNRFGDADADPPQAPRLFIHERCACLIECISNLEHDPHRPEDVLKVDCDEDGLGGDDFYDAARYGVMAAYPAPPNTIQRADPKRRAAFGYS